MKTCNQAMVSRADLIRLTHVIGIENLKYASIFAGYNLSDIPVQKIIFPRPPERKISPLQNSQEERPQPFFEPPLKSSVQFWRVESMQDRNQEPYQSQIPQWFLEVEGFQENDIRADEKQIPPEKHFLSPWPRIWPFLRSVLGAENWQGAVDLSKIVEDMARLKPMERLPRLRRYGWARQAVIIIDSASHLIPFWEDMRWLLDNLTRVRGGAGLDLFMLECGPFGPVKKIIKNRLQKTLLKPLSLGQPTLILSDLGRFGSSKRLKYDWLKWGRNIKRTASSPLVLTPVPPRMWSADMAETFRLVYWDRGQCFNKLVGSRPQFASYARNVDRKGADKLMALLAPAIRVEPELLRAVRFLLPIHEMDAADEAQVWNHAQVQSGLTAFSFDRRITAKLRKDFVNIPSIELKKRVCELIRRHHCHLSPAVINEEEMIFTILLDKSPNQEAENFFRRCIKTCCSENFMEREGLEAWMKRVVRRHERDPNMWQSDAIAVIWAKVNAEKLRQGKISLPDGLDPAKIRWVLDNDGKAETYTLVRRKNSIRINKKSSFLFQKKYFFEILLLDIVSSDGLLQIEEVMTDGFKRKYTINLNQYRPEIKLSPAADTIKLYTTHHEILLKQILKPICTDQYEGTHFSLSSGLKAGKKNMAGGRMNTDRDIRVLIAEDNYLISMEIERAVKDSGFEVAAISRNGREAVEKTCELNPDVVLMNLMMPEMNGLEAAQKIQKFCPTPVVILTAYDSIELVEKAAGIVGIGCYLIKPPRPVEIKRAIIFSIVRYAELLKYEELYDELIQQTRQLEKAQGKIKLLEEISQTGANTKKPLLNNFDMR